MNSEALTKADFHRPELRHRSDGSVHSVGRTIKYVLSRNKQEHFRSASLVGLGERWISLFTDEPLGPGELFMVKFIPDDSSEVLMLAYEVHQCVCREKAKYLVQSYLSAMIDSGAAHDWEWWQHMLGTDDDVRGRGI